MTIEGFLDNASISLVKFRDGTPNCGHPAISLIRTLLFAIEIRMYSRNQDNSLFRTLFLSQ